MAKAIETVEIASTMDVEWLMLSRKSVEWNTTPRKDVKLRRRVLRPSLLEGSPWVKAARRVRLLQERTTSRRAMPSRRASVQNEMPVISGIHLGAPVINKGSCKLGSQCATRNSVAVAKTFDIAPAGEEIMSIEIRSEGRHSAWCISDSDSEIHLTAGWKRHM